jgi:hypothetical protein
VLAAAFADVFLTVLTMRYLREEDIKGITSLLTVVRGKVVFGDKETDGYGPKSLPVSPDWAPVKKYPGHYQSNPLVAASRSAHVHTLSCSGKSSKNHSRLFGLGCDCFAF